LAQYREVEAFASFGSELDESTQHTLTRGVRLIEILNQRPYFPLPLYYQIVLIYAATRGFFDRMEVAKVNKFKNDLIKVALNPGVYSLLEEANKNVALQAVYKVYEVLINHLISQL
jgi:F0F1-type ATP synthase alpha subunit